MIARASVERKTVAEAEKVIDNSLHPNEFTY